MKLRSKSIFWGVLLMIIAAGLIINSLGLLPTIPIGFGSLILAVIMLAILIHSALDFSMTGVLFSVAHLIVIFRDATGFPPRSLSSWLLILAGTLFGIGLDVILKDFRKAHKRNNPHFEFTYSSDDDNDDDDTIEGKFVEGRTSSNNCYEFANTFGDQTKYLQSAPLKYAKLENSFGNLNIFFDDVVLESNEAWVKMENSFGKISLYVPSSFRIDLKQDNGFGNIDLQGRPSTDPQAPILHIDAENAFGSIEIRCN